MTKIKKLTSSFRKFNDRFWSNRLVMRCFLTAGTFMLAVGEMRAQGSGGTAFEGATNTIQSYRVPVSNLMKAIAAVIALVGAGENPHAHNRRLYRFRSFVGSITGIFRVINRWLT